MSGGSNLASSLYTHCFQEARTVMFPKPATLINWEGLKGGAEMIRVKDLKRRDEISIRTQNSMYRFRVIDPVRCKGLLSGGLFGEVEHEATLCHQSVTGGRRRLLPTKLGIGRSVSFYVSIRDRLRRLTTSQILDISLKRIPIQLSTVS